MLPIKKGWRGANSSNPVKIQNGGGSLDFVFNSNRKTSTFQCKTCFSDDAKFQKQGICIRCQQRAEFIIREHPQTAARALAQTGGLQ